MQEHDTKPSTGLVVALAVATFVVAGLIGAFSHLTWLMVSNSPAVAGGLIAAMAALVWYFLSLRRKIEKTDRRRPIEDLVSEFRARPDFLETATKKAAASKENSEAAAESKRLETLSESDSPPEEEPEERA